MDRDNCIFSNSCSSYKSYELFIITYFMHHKQKDISRHTMNWVEFRRAIHTSNKQKKGKSKIKFIHVLGSGKLSTELDNADIFLDNENSISSCPKKWYLGSTYTPLLETSIDIQNRINKAQHLLFSLNKLIFWKIDINIKIR